MLCRADKILKRYFQIEVLWFVVFFRWYKPFKKIKDNNWKLNQCAHSHLKQCSICIGGVQKTWSKASITKNPLNSLILEITSNQASFKDTSMKKMPLTTGQLNSTFSQSYSPALGCLADLSSTCSCQSLLNLVKNIPVWLLSRTQAAVTPTSVTSSN